MKNRDYWRRRFEILEASAINRGQGYLSTLDREYKTAMKNVETELSTWYQRFAGNNGISLAEAKQLLNKGQLAEFKWSVEDYIKYGQENALNRQWMKQLENASVKVHVTRLQALQIEMQQKIEVLYGNQLDGLDGLARKIYTEGYYHTAFEVQKGFNIGWDLTPLNQKQLDRVITKPWTLDKETFSDRIWKQKNALLSKVQTEMTQSLLRGDSPDKAIGAISKQFNVSKNQAGRLVMTESAYFASESQKDCFNALDVERFEIVATLDSHTSDLCQSLDGHIEEMKNYEAGVTAPPFHPWCRTTTVPYFEDNSGERAARGADGKTYYVPSTMKYPEWKKTFVDGGEKVGLKDVPKDDIIDNPLFPAELAGAQRGNPMSREDANGGNPNPNFDKGGGYRTNCQSCVVAYEARLRGYDVQTLPNVKGSKLEQLSRATNMAWIDPATEQFPAYLFDDAATTVKRFSEFLEKTVEEQKRYTLQFTWKGGRRSGHIISMDRNEEGVLRFYDPQTAKEYVGDAAYNYLHQFKYTMSIGGMKLPTSPKVLRIDDKKFNLDMVNHILKGVTE